MNNPIFCFGDSITYGESDAKSGGWVSMLQRYFLNKSSNDSYLQRPVYNLGIASETTDGLKRRFLVELSHRLVKKASPIVVLSYGMNDLVIHKNKNRVPIDYFCANLETCIKSAQERKAKVIISNLPFFSQRLDGQINLHGDIRFIEDVSRYNLALEELCKRTDSVLFDMNNLLNSRREEVIAADGLHPNELGHQLTYQKILALIEDLI